MMPSKNNAKKRPRCMREILLPLITEDWSNGVLGNSHHSTIPSLHHSITPIFHHSNFDLLRILRPYPGNRERRMPCQIGARSRALDQRVDDVRLAVVRRLDAAF